MNSKGVFAAWVVIATLCCGCQGGNPLQPKSGGRPYEVLVVDDVEGRVAALLSEDMAGLPQREPWFDVVTTDSAGFERNGKTMRNVVRVDISPKTTERTIIRYARDEWAAPQLVVHVITPSRQHLVKELPALAPRLRALIDKTERARTMAQLSSHHAAEPTRAVEQLFGAQMWIPVEMKASKRADSFLWVSNDAAEGMCNICVYRIASPQPERFVAQRDSVMQRHVKGETDQMYMTTVAASVFTERDGDKPEWTARGLWEMVGDAMGGPFTARVMTMADGSTVVAEAFIYAPEGRKRNLLRRTEASIYSFRSKGLSEGQGARGKR